MFAVEGEIGIYTHTAQRPKDVAQASRGRLGDVLLLIRKFNVLNSNRTSPGRLGTSVDDFGTLPDIVLCGYTRLKRLWPVAYFRGDFKNKTRVGARGVLKHPAREMCGSFK